VPDDARPARGRARSTVAWAVSAGAHVVILGALAVVHIGDVRWQHTVARGMPLTLTLLAAAPREAAEPPVSQVFERPIEPHRPARLAAARNPAVEVAVDRPADLSLAEPVPSTAEPALSRPAATTASPVPPDPAERILRSLRRKPPRISPETVTDPVTLPQAINTEAGATVDQLARKLPENPPPPYPLDARLARQEGRVLLTVDIDAGGRVVQAAVYRSSGFPLLDAAAVQAVRDWRFAPATASSRPVASQLLVPIRFSLRR
jgi:protein TonB